MEKIRKVKTLPERAVKVSTYAKRNDITPAWVYLKLKRGYPCSYSIVKFDGINFVVPAQESTAGY